MQKEDIGKSRDGGISPRASSDDDLKPPHGDRNQGHGNTEIWRRPGWGEALRPGDRRMKWRKTSSNRPPLCLLEKCTRPKESEGTECERYMSMLEHWTKFLSHDASPSYMRKHKWTDGTKDKSEITKQLSSPVTYRDFLLLPNSSTWCNAL
jgi:hypothetical protein